MLEVRSRTVVAVGCSWPRRAAPPSPPASGLRLKRPLSCVSLTSSASRAYSLSRLLSSFGWRIWSPHHVTPRVLATMCNRVVVLVPVTLAAAVSTAFAQQMTGTGRPGRPDSVPATSGYRPRLETGAAIGTIRADSIVPTAPVFQLTDLLTARLPGVDVQSGGGQTGAGARLAIRGQSSIVLSDDPIVYLDGVRVASDPGHPNPAATGLLPSGAPASGRLQDLSPNEIERIDVLPGPAATTLYGMDASHGVILVTTKRAQAVGAHWSAYAEGGPAIAPGPRAADAYTAWGHATDSAATPRICPLLARASGSCAVDSLTHFSPLRSGATSPVSNGTRDGYGGELSGGLGVSRYFFAGMRTDETGILEMPAPDAQLYKAQDGHAPLPGQKRPNALFRNNLRATLGADFGDRGNLSVFANALGGDQRATSDQTLAEGIARGSGSRGVNDGWLNNFFRPRSAFSSEVTDRVERYVYGGAGTFRIAPAVTARAVLGDDRANVHDQNYNYAIDSFMATGPDVATVDHAGTVQRTADASVETAVGGRGWSSRTTAGTQYRQETRREFFASGSVVSGLPFPAPPYTIERILQDAIQRGAFFEEALGLLDRLVVTAALRVDGPRGLLGKASQGYPRAAVSWTALSRGVDGLRLRTAYGESANLAGILSLPLLPNMFVQPGLAPERTQEFEVGADATAFAARLSVSASVYDRRTSQGVLEAPIPPSAIPNGVAVINGATIRNRGVEASAGFAVLRTRDLTWDVSLDLWANQNRIVRLGNLAPTFLAVGIRDATGHPIDDLFEPSISYRDANGDGIIEQGDVSVGRAVDYGSSTPTRALAMHNAVGLLGGRLRLGALLDYRGGYRLIDDVLAEQLLSGTARGDNDPRASLLQQAQAVAAAVIVSGPDGIQYFGPPQDASFVRLRELSFTLVASPGTARALHTTEVSISLLARNLWLWTRYTGTDPEFNTHMPVSLQNTFAVVPQPRYFVLRVNLGM
jgi:TonB-dependent starch-binding outer membrane protein SusC